jgi:hypothetical protein
MANVKDVVSTNADLINYLLANKFHTLSNDDKIFVKKLPVPQPSMVDLIQSKVIVHFNYFWNFRVFSG